MKERKATAKHNMYAAIDPIRRSDLTGNIDTYTMYLRGMQLLQEYTQSSCQEAIALFES